MSLSDNLEENLDKDADPLPERLYDVKKDRPCAKCGRNLKGKIAYLNFDNKLICRDITADLPPVEIILCQIFTKIHMVLESHKIKLQRSSLKRIDKILTDSLER